MDGNQYINHDVTEKSYCWGRRQGGLNLQIDWFISNHGYPDKTGIRFQVKTSDGEIISFCFET